MQICRLSAIEGMRLQRSTFVPDCRLHCHLSKKDANELAAAGRVAFVSERAVVVVGPSPLSGYWYDEVTKKDDHHYLGTAKSGTAHLGWARTRQLVNFMPRGMKHTVKGIEACGARQRRMSATTVT